MAERIAPITNHLAEPFWSAASASRLCLPRCVASGRAFWPPSPSSPFVTGGAVEWHDMPARGVVRSLVVYRRAFQKALADRVPYGVALVEVAPGLRLQAHVAAPDDPRSPGPGDVVGLAFAPLREGESAVIHVAGRRNE
jgi:uncharacterized OB-fold protein